MNIIHPMKYPSLFHWSTHELLGIKVTNFYPFITCPIDWEWMTILIYWLTFSLLCFSRYRWDVVTWWSVDVIRLTLYRVWKQWNTIASRYARKLISIFEHEVSRVISRVSPATIYRWQMSTLHNKAQLFYLFFVHRFSISFKQLTIIFTWLVKHSYFLVLNNLMPH